MSEELTQKGLTEHGLGIGNYEFYNIGSTTLNQLKTFRVIPDKEYAGYGSRKPDALLVDRRNLSKIRVLSVIEVKENEKFKSESDKKTTVQQCNDVSQVLGAEVGIATDLTTFIWFNPRQSDPLNGYKDQTTGGTRSYSLIKDEKGADFIKDFVIDQKQDEQDLAKVTETTRKSIQSLETVRKSISPINSRLIEEPAIDPTILAKQIWQDIWLATGAAPDKCLYTFVELFIFKYLSDLNLLTEDTNGNNISFKHIFGLGPNYAFRNYVQNARPYLRTMFPENPEDQTTIINGTVLNINVKQHGLVFYKILKRFNEYPELKNIDPRFKSKVFEEFMKETISRKNWGQFFTPRNIIDAMVEMSGIDKLPEGSLVCDPACGVGGFILEPLKVKTNGIDFYYKIQGNEIKPRLKFIGYDKGIEKEEQLVIILAKANMLIFLSELLKKNPTLAKEFSTLFNSTFKLLSSTILGTLSITEPDKYDLILTNPPYVTSGSSNYKDAINEDGELKKFYKVQATGVEGLFLEWIINSLKPEKSALVIVPHGVLLRGTDKLKGLIRNECVIDAIISLPVNTFYRNSQKTYILVLTKKSGNTPIERKEQKQTEKEPVFTFLVSNVGETLNVKRFPIDENDLPEMVSLFNQFKGAKNTFSTLNKRCKIQPADKFKLESDWLVDRWWSREEKAELCVAKKLRLMSLSAFKDKAGEIEKTIHELNEHLKAVNAEQEMGKYAKVSLGDEKIFKIDNGERIRQQDIQRAKGTIPVYSASIFENFALGYVSEKIEDVVKGARAFDGINLTANADGSDYSVFVRKSKFYANDVCNVITVLAKDIDPYFLKHELRTQIYEAALNYQFKLYKKKLRTLTARIPINDKGEFDLDKQKAFGEKYEKISQMKDKLTKYLRELSETLLIT